MKCVVCQKEMFFDSHFCALRCQTLCNNKSPSGEYMPHYRLWRETSSQHEHFYIGNLYLHRDLRDDVFYCKYFDEHEWFKQFEMPKETIYGAKNIEERIKMYKVFS